jgi:orotate phosphoribosyltransferase
MTQDQRTRLIELLLARSFKLGDFTLSSGKKSEYYVDCRTSTLHPEGLTLIVGQMLPTLQGWGAQAAGGLTLGADPLAAGVALATADLPADRRIVGYIVRKEAKGHGRGRQVEGCLEPGMRAAVLEDVITTGESALRAVAAVREAGASVVGVMAIVDREEGGREAIEREGLKVVSLFTASELKAAAQK